MKNSSYSTLSDEELVGLIQSEDHMLNRKDMLDILGELYLRYADLLLGVCLKYLRGHQAAEDAVMDIYIQLSSILSFQKISNFRGWLYVFCKNFCLMQLRKDKRMLKVELENDILISEDFFHLNTVFERENTFHLLEKCIDNLTVEQQKIIRLFYFEHKCYKEIIEITGFEWGKVRSSIQNARKNIKNCMGK